MTATIKMAVTIRKELFEQAESLAKQLQISRSDLLERAVENFVRDHPEAQAEQPAPQIEPAACPEIAPREIHQGDVYWVPLEAPDDSEPGYTHPHVVVQADVLNRSRIQTVVVCALTSNIKRAKAPGNVLLEAGEANLSRQSVVVVSQVSTVDKTQLGDYIGSLSEQRVEQIFAGMQFLQTFIGRREP